MRVRYHGWSGVTVENEDRVVGFDLPDRSVVPRDSDRNFVLCVTHGHPDHCGALLDACNGETWIDEATLVSSPVVVEHFRSGRAATPGDVRSITPRDSRSVEGLELAAFEWQHMPLLPPGVSEKIQHLVSVASRPLELARIATDGLRLPIDSPTLGFHVSFDGGTTVLNYGEGLHRMTSASEVDRVARRFPDIDLLLSAVEPEDRDEVPRWIRTLSPDRAFLYEAHRPWRETFGLGTLALEEYAAEVDERLADVRIGALVSPGETVAL
ncbi:MAG: MBL fold metallo-hydrolase [Bradymonadaceae bacterium]